MADVVGQRVDQCDRPRRLDHREGWTVSGRFGLIFHQHRVELRARPNRNVNGCAQRPRFPDRQLKKPRVAGRAEGAIELNWFRLDGNGRRSFPSRVGRRDGHGGRRWMGYHPGANQEKYRNETSPHTLQCTISTPACDSKRFSGHGP